MTKQNYKPRYSRKVGRIVVGPSYFWSPQMESQLRKLYATTTNEELADLFNMGVATIRRKAKSMGLEKSREWFRKIMAQHSHLAVAKNRAMGFPTCFKKGQKGHGGSEKGRKLSDKAKVNISKAQKERFSRPEEREKARQRTLAYWERKRNQNIE